MTAGQTLKVRLLGGQYVPQNPQNSPETTNIFQNNTRKRLTKKSNVFLTSSYI